MGDDNGGEFGSTGYGGAADAMKGVVSRNKGASSRIPGGHWAKVYLGECRQGEPRLSER
jgi:hypothetical protein